MMQLQELVTVPNAISLLRGLIALLVFLLWAHTTLSDGVFITLILLALVTDGLDGLLARLLRQQSTLGKILDPVMDKVATWTFLIIAFLDKGLPLWGLIYFALRDAALLAGYLRYRIIFTESLAQKFFGALTTILLLGAIVLYVLDLKVAATIILGGSGLSGVYSVLEYVLQIMKTSRWLRRALPITAMVVGGVIFGVVFAHYDWDYEEVEMPRLEGKRILMIVAPRGFNPQEYRIPRELLEQSGARVVVASTHLEELISERWPFWNLRRLKINADILIEEVDVSKFDAIIFVGGGEEMLIHDPAIHAIAQEALASGKVVAAICRAPLILAEAGVLNGRKATAWHPFGLIRKHLQAIEEKGALAVKEDVVVDGQLVTANRPTHASAFTEAIARLLAEE
jgi:protease I